MVNDKIADLINKIKIASLSGKETVSVPHSKMTISILDLLKKEEYINDYSIVGKDYKKEIAVNLKYDDGQPTINEVKRVSKVSNRIYKPTKKIHPVRNGYGLLVMSTSKGIMSDKEARRENVGGEALFELW